MRPLPLSESVLEALFSEARGCFPREACGVVVGPREDPAAQRFVAFENQQDKLHALDPEAHPRDARTAYAMNPLKLQRLVDSEEAAGGALVAIAHSHPQHPSYFSDTDKRAAAPFGLPSFPDATQLVVSVFDGEVRDLKGFSWDGEAWLERPLAGLPALPGPPEGATILGEEI